jgi:two-component system, cell cycle response regulator DivK
MKTRPIRSVICRLTALSLCLGAGDAVRAANKSIYDLSLEKLAEVVVTDTKIGQPRDTVIEDNEQNLYLATFLLETGGFTIIPARSGPEGIELAARVLPNLIVLDIQLPGMDGYAVARALRQNPTLKDVLVVAVTSDAVVGDREKAMEAGCTGDLEKPINPDIFKSESEQYLKSRPSGGGIQP